jgi:hypothetical protein
VQCIAQFGFCGPLRGDDNVSGSVDSEGAKSRETGLEGRTGGGEGRSVEIAHHGVYGIGR